MIWNEQKRFRLYKWFFAFIAMICGIAIITVDYEDAPPRTTARHETVYRSQDSADDHSDTSVKNIALRSGVTNIISNYYGENHNIIVSHVDSARSFVEIRVDGISLGGDRSYQWISAMCSDICALQDGTVILHALGQFGILTDYHAIEVFRGNRKPKYWTKYYDEPWETNTWAYGAGLVSREDEQYEVTRVKDELGQRGLIPRRRIVQSETGDDG